MTSALTGAYRALGRHRLFALLNIGGLALGIAVFLVLFLFVRFETDYDRTLPGWQRVWTIERTIRYPGSPEFQIPSSPELLGQVQAAFPGLVGARVASYDTATVVTGQASSTRKLALVDPAWFRLFPLPAIEGDAAATLARPDGIVVTRTVARTYFGEASPLGRTLTVARDGKPVVYRIGAVIEDLPANMTFRSELFAAIPPIQGPSDQAVDYGVTTFLSLPDAAAAERIARFIRRHPDPKMNPDGAKLLKQRLTPLARVHLADEQTRTIVTVLGTVGVVALLLAMVNYVNLATARAGLRAREIAMRKVLGATRGALIGQLLGEACVAVTLAALVGLALAELTLPFVNTVGGTDLAIAYWGGRSILPPLALLIAVTTLLAGFYPAFVVSRFRPAGVLAAAQTPGGDRTAARLRKGLVVLQFGIAIALMIGTAVLVAQTRHVQNSDIGFGRGGLVVVDGYADTTLDAAQRTALANAIRAVPGVASMTTSGIVPGGGFFWIAKMHRTGAIGDAPMIVRGTVGAHFFETYRATLLAGRLFDSSRFALDIANGDKDPPSRTANVILNRAAIRRLGFDRPADAIGRVVVQEDGPGRTGLVRIVGVVADMRFGSPRAPVDALTYGYQPDGGSHAVLVIRTAGAIPPVLSRIETLWHRIAPAVPPGAVSMDQKLYETFYRNDSQRSRLFTIGAVLAVVIGCLGLYGLAASETARRVREIGIRKTLGASTSEILRLLIGQFLRPVLLANLIAWPIAFVAMRRWLTDFDDRIALSPWYFIGASIVALAIAALTVLGHAARVARAEPARALRHE